MEGSQASSMCQVPNITSSNVIAPLDELSVIWLVLTHLFHYLQIVDQWDQLYARYRIDVAGRPISKLLFLSFIMLHVTRKKQRADVLKYIYGDQYKYQAPLTLTILLYSAFLFCMLDLLSLDRLYYMRWQGIDRLAPLEFMNVKPVPLYYLIRSNYPKIERWVQLILSIWNIIAFFSAVTVSILESSPVMKLQLWLF